MHVTDETYEKALKQWTPKIEGLAKRWVPYQEQDDLRQELQIVLYKCLNGYHPYKSSLRKYLKEHASDLPPFPFVPLLSQPLPRNKFHTYLHRAMLNRLGDLTVHAKRHVMPEPASVVYLGQVDLDAAVQDDGVMGAAKILKALQVPFEESVEGALTGYGFEGWEIVWVSGSCEGLSIQEIADMNHVEYRVIYKAYRAAKKKIYKLREEVTSYA